MLLLPLLLLPLAAPRPNILFIGVDDLRPNLGPYSGGSSFLSPEIHSPALDQLASTGTVFESAYCQGSN